MRWPPRFGHAHEAWPGITLSGIVILAAAVIADALGETGMRHDLLLTGGHVIDPASGVDGRRDVAFASGKVAAVDAAIPRESAREVVDVTGAYVAPGLVDLHAHAFIAGHDLGIETDAVCASTGVTTLCDAGSTGAAST